MKNTLTIVHSENCGPAGKCNCKAFDRATFRPYGLRPGSANSKLDEGLTPGQTDQRDRIITLTTGYFPWVLIAYMLALHIYILQPDWGLRQVIVVKSCDIYPRIYQI